MTTEESIRFADKLASDYEALAGIRKEIADCEAALQSMKSFNDSTVVRSSGYFVPFSLLALAVFIAEIFIFIIGYLLLWAKHSPFTGGFLLAGLIVPVISVVVILSIGGIKAEKKKAYLNKKAADDKIKRENKRASLQNDLIALHDREKLLAEELETYNGVVPSDMRSKSRMEMIKVLLKNGKAATFEEAVAHLSHSAK